MRQTALDPYIVLGVTKSANQQAIKQAYYSAAKKWHPDVLQSKSNKEIEDKFKQITMAYDILSDSTL
jgi:molecular chaperone DnaJ